MALADRVRGLIDSYFGGERNAARLTGVARMTLRRLAAGEIPDPRHSVLVKLANATGADVGWFVTGQGKGPNQVDPTGLRLPSVELWREFVDDLDLPPESRNAMLTLPRSTSIAFLSLVARGDDPDDPPPTDVLVRSQELEVRAWVTFFGGLIKHYGMEAVRAKLSSEPEILGCQFNPVLTRLWSDLRHLEPATRKRWEESMWGWEDTRASDRRWDDVFSLGPAATAHTPPLVEGEKKVSSSQPT